MTHFDQVACCYSLRIFCTTHGVGVTHPGTLVHPSATTSLSREWKRLVVSRCAVARHRSPIGSRNGASPMTASPCVRSPNRVHNMLGGNELWVQFNPPLCIERLCRKRTGETGRVCPLDEERIRPEIIRSKNNQGGPEESRGVWHRHLCFLLPALMS